ncbi:MAG: MscL family protein [Thermoproteota archaeon]
MAKEDKMLEELKEIRKLLTPSPAPSPPEGLWDEFTTFLSKYKVMGLAVAFIIGVYLGNLVQALVADLVMPVVGLALPGMDNLATYQYQVSNQIFKVGDFLVALVTFIIVAFVIFILVKITKKWGLL